MRFQRDRRYRVRVGVQHEKTPRLLFTEFAADILIRQRIFLYEIHCIFFLLSPVKTGVFQKIFKLDKQQIRLFINQFRLINNRRLCRIFHDSRRICRLLKPESRKKLIHGNESDTESRSRSQHRRHPDEKKKF